MGFLLGFIGLALLDSLNPSAIFITFALLLTHKPIARTVSYIAGNFLTNFTLGALVYFGLGSIFQSTINAVTAWINNLYPYAEHPLVVLVQVLVAIYLIYQVFITTPVKSEKTTIDQNKLKPYQTFLLGVGVTFVDFATAAPYLAAIALLSKYQLGSIQEVLLLVLYNIIFVWIPIVLVLVYLINKKHISDVMDYIKNITKQYLPNLLKIVFALGALALMTDSILWLFGKSIF